MKRRRSLGVIVMVSLTLFPLLAAASSRRSACINNLRQIDAAKDEYALEYGGTNGMIYTWDNIALYIKNMDKKIFCPSATVENRAYSNNYKINPLGIDPVCMVEGKRSFHALNQTAWQKHRASLQQQWVYVSVGTIAGIAGLSILSFVYLPFRLRQPHRIGKRDIAVAAIVAYLACVIAVSCIWHFGPSPREVSCPPWLLPFIWPISLLHLFMKTSG